MQVVKCVFQKTESFIYPYLKQKEKGKDGSTAWAAVWLIEERKGVDSVSILCPSSTPRK